MVQNIGYPAFAAIYCLVRLDWADDRRVHHDRLPDLVNPRCVCTLQRNALSKRATERVDLAALANAQPYAPAISGRDGGLMDKSLVSPPLKNYSVHTPRWNTDLWLAATASSEKLLKFVFRSCCALL